MKGFYSMVLCKNDVIKTDSSLSMINLDDFENSGRLIIPRNIFNALISEVHGVLQVRVHCPVAQKRRVLHCGILDAHNLEQDKKNAIFMPSWMYSELCIMHPDSKPNIIMHVLEKPLPKLRELEICPLTWKFLLCNTEIEPIHNDKGFEVDMEGQPLYDGKKILTEIMPNLCCLTRGQTVTFKYKKLPKISFKVTSLSPRIREYNEAVSCVDAGEVKLIIDNKWFDKIVDRADYDRWISQQKLKVKTDKATNAGRLEISGETSGEDSFDKEGDDGLDANPAPSSDNSWGQGRLLGTKGFRSVGGSSDDKAEKGLTIDIINYSTNKTFDNLQTIKETPSRKFNGNLVTEAEKADSKALDLVASSSMTEAISQKQHVRGWGSGRKL